jgi:hypothetical protein
MLQIMDVHSSQIGERDNCFDIHFMAEGHVIQLHLQKLLPEILLRRSLFTTCRSHANF